MSMSTSHEFESGSVEDYSSQAHNRIKELHVCAELSVMYPKLVIETIQHLDLNRL
jgi:hypothetical protein